MNIEAVLVIFALMSDELAERNDFLMKMTGLECKAIPLARKSRTSPSAGNKPSTAPSPVGASRVVE